MTSSGKVRIYELSRDMGLENKDVLDAAIQLGVAAKSHSSSISDDEAAQIRSLIKQGGAAGQPSAAQPAAAPAKADAVKPVPAQLPEVMATVNGESISKAEFEAAVRNIEASSGGPVPAEQRDQVYRGVLDQLVGYKLLLQEVKARGGELHVLADQDTKMTDGDGLHVIRMPDHAGLLSPILHTIPLQMLAYHTALERGNDVDKPRNLAKSVTVE